MTPPLYVVDSSGSLEYLADGPNADHFAAALAKPDCLIVPALSIFEVFKRMLQQRDESAALSAAALMQQGQVVDLDAALAIAAAKLSADRKLSLADAVTLATARRVGTLLLTQDAHFDGLAGVSYVPARRG